MMRADRCENCGVEKPLHELDAKPIRLAGRRNTWRQMKKALRRNEDFDRLECARCYGPNFCIGVAANAIAAAEAAGIKEG